MLESFRTIVLYIGIFDAAIIMVFGVVAAALMLFGTKEQRDAFFERVFPSIAVLVGASLAAALVLGAVRWLMG